MDTAVERVHGAKWASITSLHRNAFSTLVSTDETARLGALAAALVANRQRIDNLEEALRSNREIGVAMGVLMATHKVTREQAFDLFRLASQNANRKLRDVAHDVADTGQLPSLLSRRDSSR